MRFPLRRQHTPEAIMERISRIEDRFPQEPVAPAEEPFDVPEVAYAWGQPPIAPAPAETVFPPSFKQIQPLPMPSSQGAAETAPAAVAPQAEPSPAPRSEPFPIPTPIQAPMGDFRLREQSSASDVRADRLVRQVRNEVDQLRQSLESLSAAPDEMFEVDRAALVADPEHATTLPPAALVRAVVETVQEADALRKELRAEKEKRLKLQRRMREVRRMDAARQARLDALEQVIGALHDNLQDLRLERDRSRLSAMHPAAALRPGPGQLPASGTGMSSCE